VARLLRVGLASVLAVIYGRRIIVLLDSDIFQIVNAGFIVTPRLSLVGNNPAIECRNIARPNSAHMNPLQDQARQWPHQKDLNQTAFDVVQTATDASETKGPELDRSEDSRWASISAKNGYARWRVSVFRSPLTTKSIF
jgi:hypothetical protein